jgi:hypothetical protein
MSGSAARPCAVCGQPTRAETGVCQRTAECRTEHQRRYRQAKPEAARERQRLRRKANPEAIRREKARDYQNRREAIIEKERRRRLTHGPELNRKRRLRREAAGGSPTDHLRRALTAQIWSSQQGLCYLCDEPVPLKDAHLEHDHRCCPTQKIFLKGKICRRCIRGVAHNGCNAAIGHFRDDPDLLEHVARNLRAKLAEINQRWASEPDPVTLF